MDKDSLEKFRELVKDIGVANMTTLCKTHGLVSRPMYTREVDDDGLLWFFSDDNEAKVKQIEANRLVNLAYADTSGQKYISVSGKGAIVRDVEMKKKLWNRATEVWMQKQPEDPGVVLIKVDPEYAEYWQSAGKVAGTIDFLKSLITGERPDSGEHGKMKL